MDESPEFLFVCCQRGAEAALKAEMSRWQPEMRFAYSRPGFVTFKCPPVGPNQPWASDEPFDLPLVFARAYGVCLGKLEGTDGNALAESFWRLVGDERAARLHVWQRDAALPGQHGFEPGVSVLAEEVAELLIGSRPSDIPDPPPQANLPASTGQRVLDCILVEPNQWWVGRHRALTPPTCWPGGTYRADYPPGQAGLAEQTGQAEQEGLAEQGGAVSRSFLKMNEALAWSRLPVAPGDRCVEIGSAPGGSCQALLARGLYVVGIDPAEMDPQVMEHPRFTHVRKRATDVKRRDFRDVRWLVADSNVAPTHTLDTVESIVTHGDVHVRGLLLTLKLPQWKLADQIDDYLQRIRGWGFRYVRARQLAYNRREICVHALQRRSLRRSRAISGGPKR